jgi:hypothetical protein
MVSGLTSGTHRVDPQIIGRGEQYDELVAGKETESLQSC